LYLFVAQHICVTLRTIKELVHVGKRRAGTDVAGRRLAFCVLQGYQMQADIIAELNGGIDGSLGSPHAHDSAAGGIADSRVASEARSSGSLPQLGSGVAVGQLSSTNRDELQR
jgi:hypothetical protein